MIKVTAAHYECVMCPMTIVGKTAGGETIYARYRWGHLSVRIDSRDPPPNGGAEGTWIFSEQIGDEYAGWISYEDLKTHTQHIVEWPVQEPD